MATNSTTKWLNQNFQDLRIDRIMQKYPYSILQILVIMLIMVQTISCNNGGSSEKTNVQGPTGVNSCGGFADGTEREHRGMQKKQFCDKRDGKKYVYVEIGEQVWMAENLNFNADGSICYHNMESDCDKYGRLYDWSTAMALDTSCNNINCSGQTVSKHRGICPEGWHIPTYDEWNVLVNFAGVSVSATKLKAKEDWGSASSEHPVIPGTDDYGFSALPGGSHTPGYSPGSQIRSLGSWWSATESIGAKTYMMLSGSADAYAYDSGKQTMLSVRCVLGSKKHFTVAFNTNGGTPAAIPYVAIDSGATFWPKYPANPTREGYTFAGWFDGDELYTSSTTIIKDVTLVAAWNENDKLDDREDGEALIDSRNGQSYRTVFIGGKQWMAENLNYETDESWCYDDVDSNCETYGRLYTFEAALAACPAEWRLPDNDDWTGLIRAAGGNEVGGNALKSKTNWDGTDHFGFSALPGGYRDSYDGSFAFAGGTGFWWSTMEGGPWTMSSSVGSVSAMLLSHGRDGSMYSVRCVTDL